MRMRVLLMCAAAVGFAMSTSDAKVSNQIFAVAEAVTGRVQVYDINSGNLLVSFKPANLVDSGHSVAIGDLNNDGFDDLIVGAGKNNAPNIHVYDGADLVNNLVTRKFVTTVYSPAYRNGVFVTSADTNNDGRDDIIVGPRSGLVPEVAVYQMDPNFTLPFGSFRFFAFGAGFTGGVRVAALDFDSDNKAEIVCGQGSGGNRVRVFAPTDYLSNGTPPSLASFFAFEAGYTGGVYVAAGNVLLTGRDEIVVGRGSGTPDVRIFETTNFANVTLAHSFQAYPDTLTSGVRVGVANSPWDENGYFTVLTACGKNFPAALGHAIDPFPNYSSDLTGSDIWFSFLFNGKANGFLVGGL